MEIIDQRHFGVVDGFEIKATLTPDPDSTPYDADCYSAEDIEAWKSDRWQYVTVIVTASIDGHEFGSASLGAVECGDLGNVTLLPLTNQHPIKSYDMITDAIVEAKRNADELHGKVHLVEIINKGTGWTDQQAIRLTRPCDLCNGGTFLPSHAPKVHLDADGSGMIDVRCSNCRSWSVVYFTWDGPYFD